MINETNADEKFKTLLWMAATPILLAWKLLVLIGQFIYKPFIEWR